MSDNNKNDKLLTKIKNLFELANNNPNENEAKAAMLKAQELMVKYQIEKSSVDGVEVDPKKVITVSLFENKGRILWYEKKLSNMIAKNFKVTQYISRSKYNSTIMFLGLEDDVNIALNVYGFAMNQMKKLANKYIKTISSSSSSNVRNDYYTGFINGLEEAFKEQIEKNNWGLVLVKDALVLQEEEKLNLRYVRPTGIQPKFDYDDSHINKGYSDGFNTGSSYKNKDKLID